MSQTAEYNLRVPIDREKHADLIASLGELPHGMLGPFVVAALYSHMERYQAGDMNRFFASNVEKKKPRASADGGRKRPSGQAIQRQEIAPIPPQATSLLSPAPSSVAEVAISTSVNETAATVPPAQSLVPQEVAGAPDSAARNESDRDELGPEITDDDLAALSQLGGDF